MIWAANIYKFPGFVPQDLPEPHVGTYALLEHLA